MKKSLFIAIALTAVFSGCVKDGLRNEQEEYIDANAPVFHAGFADMSPDTKTYLNEGGHLRWNADDRLTIFVGKTLNTEYAFDGDDGDNAGEFLQVSGGSFATGNPLDANYAVYPYSKSTKISEEGVISLSLPAVQAYGEDSFGRGTNTMVAVTEDTDDYFLPFKNVCGYLVVSLYGDATITSVSLTGNNGEKIAGDATVTPSFGGNPSVAMKDSATETVSIDCGEGVELGTTKETATAFWFCIPQTSFTTGFTITATAEDGTSFQKSTSKTISVERNKIYSMAALKFEANYGNIHFEDPAAKFACVAKFDTDGDGEVSYEEAAAVTSFAGLFTDWNTIESFDEISYFKNVHSLSGVFNGCKNLVSITIPENITDLGTYAFRGCSSLTSIELPSGITAIGDFTFQSCSKLSSIDLPSKVTSIGSYAFSNCSSLAQVDIPDGVKSIPDYCFYGCDLLTSVTLPSGITSIGEGAFRYVNMWKLELPSSVTSLASNCFGDNILCVIVPSTSAVSIRSNTFSGTRAIYVPSSLIEMYKLMTGWADISSKVHPISEYKEKNEFNLGTSGAIDMGLSVKWAAYNVGATKPEEYGAYYQWAGLEDVTNISKSLNWSNCPYHMGSNEYSGWTKYLPSNKSSYWSGTGSPDNKIALDSVDDAAYVNWGGTWRMATIVEWRKLVEGCYWEWSTYEGINGYMVYSFETGNKIFMPAAGYHSGVGVTNAGSEGNYWSSDLHLVYPHNACVLDFGSFRVSTDYGDNRCYGLSVRPVCE